MENIQYKHFQIETLLNEILVLIKSEIGDNPFEDLDTAIKIISQKNYKQLTSIDKKIRNLSMLLYNRNLENRKVIFAKLDEIHFLITA
jgi:hypothetical protein